MAGCEQDDSSMNRRIVSRILRSELADTIIFESDDGDSAIEVVKAQAAEGNKFDFILIDNIMVLSFLSVKLGYFNQLCRC